MNLPTAIPSRTNRAISLLKKLLFYKPPQLPTMLATHNNKPRKVETMTEETEERESTGKQPPAPTIREENGLLHITVEGKTYVATQAMLAGGQFLPVENLAGLRRFFDSRLICWPDSHFSWIDGTVELRTRLVTVGDHYSFIEKDGLVEVPEPMARGYDDLRWIVEAGYELVDGRDFTAEDREGWNDAQGAARWYYDPIKACRRKFWPGETMPRMYLVPEADWLSHAGAIVGVSWAAADQDAILSKARGLGYKDPERATKPVSSQAKVSPPTGVSNLDQCAHVAPEFS